MNALRPLLLSALCLTQLGAVRPPARDQGLLVDIRDVSGSDIEAIKQTDGVDWWLELGDQLLLVGDRSRLTQQSTASLRGSIELNAIRSDRLALHARGCAEHTTTIGAPIAEAGRWELRRLDADETMPLSDEWHAVGHDQVLASRYRPEEHAIAGADPAIQAVVDAINPTRWFADVTTLASWDRHSRNTAQLTLARDWIGSQFSALGLAVTTPSFTSGSLTANNVIGTWTGTTLPDEWIIVGGHYDSRNANSGSTTAAITNTPGAEDNASGCSGVIELARAIITTQPQRSIVFTCYSGEEQGLLGSTAHVNALTAAGNLVKVKHAMIMDMIGYSATPAVEVLLESNQAQRAIIDVYAAAAATYVPELAVMTATNANGSDHVPYLNAGRSSLLTIENDWNIYPHYHKTTDTPANMGVNALAMGGAILRMNAAVLAQISSSDRIYANGFDSTP